MVTLIHQYLCLLLLNQETKESKELDWYNAKGLFKHVNDDKDMKDKYEETVFVLKAGSEDDAMERAIKLFNGYADEDIGIMFTGHYEICRLFEPVKNGSEVYWSMRISRLSPKKYVERYWNEGRPDSCDEKGWTHVWYNKDNKNSGCFNCNEVRKGQLWKKASKGSQP